MSLSVFDIFKVGIGPSSSHTMGPMRAAREFVLGLKRDGLLQATSQIAVRLYGSLALTGVGHGTDRAVLAGLEGAEPETVDPDAIEPILRRIRNEGRIKLLGEHEIAFDEPMQLLFMRHWRNAANTGWNSTRSYWRTSGRGDLRRRYVPACYIFGRSCRLAWNAAFGRQEFFREF
jgi:hypothetical protein